MTTNGVLLEGFTHELKEAGLDRVDISLDTINPEVYSIITRSNSEYLENVRNGLESAIAVGFYPIKLNMVILNGLNDVSIDKMTAFAKSNKVILQLIELLDKKSPLYFNLNSMEKKLEMWATKVKKRHLHGIKKYFINSAEVAVVRPHRPEFCMNCHRIRVTSDGRFKLCLLKKDTVEINNIQNSFIEAVHKREPFLTQDVNGRYKPKERCNENRNSQWEN